MHLSAFDTGAQSDTHHQISTYWDCLFLQPISDNEATWTSITKLTTRIVIYNQYDTIQGPESHPVCCIFCCCRKKRLRIAQGSITFLFVRTGPRNTFQTSWTYAAPKCFVFKGLQCSSIKTIHGFHVWKLLLTLEIESCEPDTVPSSLKLTAPNAKVIALKNHRCIRYYG